MSPAWRTILVRYGEIGIKGPSVRARFERQLASNIERVFAREGIEGAVDRERGRLFVRSNHPEAALRVLSRTFGVVGAKLVQEMPAEKEEILGRVAEAARSLLGPGQSFAVRVRRTGVHPFTSMELARDVGSAVYLAHDGENPVDLTKPDVQLEIEVRGDRAYFVERKVLGPGGLPVGTQGKVVVLAEDERGVTAAWLLLKRGVTALVLLPEPVAAGTRTALGELARWAPRLEAQAFTVPASDPATRRAFLLAVGSAVVARRKASAVAVGDGIRGAQAFAGLDAVAGAPVFRPLLGYPGDLTAALAEESGIPIPPEPETHVHAPPVTPPPAGEVEAAVGTLRLLAPEAAL